MGVHIFAVITKTPSLTHALPVSTIVQSEKMSQIVCTKCAWRLGRILTV